MFKKFKITILFAFTVNGLIQRHNGIMHTGGGTSTSYIPCDPREVTVRTFICVSFKEMGIAPIHRHS